MIRERYCQDGENEQKAEDECVGDFPLHASFLHHATASVEQNKKKWGEKPSQALTFVFVFTSMMDRSGMVPMKY